MVAIKSTTKTITTHTHGLPFTENSRSTYVSFENVSQLYSKSKVPTDDLLNKVPKDCVNLRDKILKIIMRSWDRTVVACTVIKELCNTTVVVIDVGTLVLHSNGNLRLDQ